MEVTNLDLQLSVYLLVTYLVKRVAMSKQSAVFLKTFNDEFIFKRIR